MLLFAKSFAVLVLAGAAPTVAAATTAAKYATYLDKGVITAHLFETPRVNKMPTLVPYESKGQVQGELLDSFYSGVNFSFYCPHYLWVSGIDALYDGGEGVGSYTFKVTCALLKIDEDYVKKTSCEEGLTPTAAEEHSSCHKPEQFIQGLAYMKYSKHQPLPDPYRKSLCCSAADSKGAPLQALSERCSTSSLFPAGTSFTMRCGNDMVLKKIDATYDASARARAFSFTCCPLGRS